MAVGIYKLPICDGCKLPWLPVGWTQDSDPRNPDKPLRCGKCKSIGWDREFVKAEKAEATKEETPEIAVSQETGMTQVLFRVLPLPVEPAKSRCKHRMADCPICHPKEAA